MIWANPGLVAKTTPERGWTGQLDHEVSENTCSSKPTKKLLWSITVNSGQYLRIKWIESNHTCMMHISHTYIYITYLTMCQRSKSPASTAASFSNSATCHWPCSAQALVTVLKLKTLVSRVSHPPVGLQLICLKQCHKPRRTRNGNHTIKMMTGGWCKWHSFSHINNTQQL